MKSFLLFLLFTLTGVIAFAQVIFQVQAPVSLIGNYALTWADPADNDWATPDLNNPANSVTGTLQFVDVLGGDTLACAPPLTANLTNKIAVLYRGDCQFGSKALAAQNAGAIACIIINNIPGPPVGTGGGTDGLSVIIPVIMISDVDGDSLRNEIIAGNVIAYIGSKAGMFNNDLGATKADVLMARRFSNLLPLAQSPTEFNVPTGAWVRNYGSQTQNNATLDVNILFGGSLLYSNSAPINGLAPNDSIYVSLGTFSQTPYSEGYYTMTYTITTQNPDGDSIDNVISADFMLDSAIYSYGRRDENNGQLLSPAGSRPATFTTGYENCIAFNDSNASRLQANGMTFSVSANQDDNITNEFAEVVAYEWNDVFTDINDPNFGFANLVEVDNVFHVFQSDNEQDSNIYVPFNSPITLVDNQRYLFCFRTQSTILFLGFDNQLDYTTTQNTYLQPSFPSTVDNTNAYLNGFGLENVPALSVTFAPAGTVGVEEVENSNDITPYPNPAANIINIPVGKFNGLAQVDIYDVTGKLVATENVNLSSTSVISVDVANIENGTYIFKMTFADESTKAFNVLISR